MSINNLNLTLPEIGSIALNLTNLKINSDVMDIKSSGFYFDDNYIKINQTVNKFNLTADY